MRIVDDHLTESVEEFYTLLITTVNGPILSQPSARIVIIDDEEGVFVCSYMLFISTVIYFFIFHLYITISVLLILSSILIFRSGDNRVPN